MRPGSKPQTIHTYGKANQRSSIFISIHHTPGYLKPCPPTAWQALQNKIQAYHTGQAAYADQMQQRNKAELQQRIARLKQQAKQPGCGSKEHERLSRQLAEARHKLGQIQRQQYISHTLEHS